MKLVHAQTLAQHLVKRIEPFCEPGSVRIVGSIRRGKPEVKDIEIIALPKTFESFDLMGEVSNIRESGLLDWALKTQIIKWCKAGRGTLAENSLEFIQCPAPEGKYWRGLINAPGWEPVMLDMFLPDPRGYGAQELIRTGSAEFSEAVVTHAKRCGFAFRDGLLYGPGKAATEVIPTASESDVFTALNLVCIPPAQRIDKHSLKGKA